MRKFLKITRLLTLLLFVVDGNVLANVNTTYENQQFGAALARARCAEDRLNTGVTFSAFQRRFPVVKGSNINSGASDASLAFEISRSAEMPNLSPKSPSEIERAVRKMAAKGLIVSYYLEQTDSSALANENFSALTLDGLFIMYQVVEGGHTVRTMTYQVVVRDSVEPGELQITSGSMGPIVDMLACSKRE